MAQAQQQQEGFNWQKIIMMLVFWWFLFRRGPTGAPNTPAPAPGKPGEAPIAGTAATHNNVFPPQTRMDLWVYISELNESFVPQESTLVWEEKNFIFGDWDDKRTKSITLIPSETLKKNGTIFAHSFLTKPDDVPHSSEFSGPLLSTIYQLNRYVKRNLAKEKKNLMSGELDEAYVKRKQWEDENPTATPTTIQIESRWKGNLTLTIVTDFTAFPRGQIPGPVAQRMKFDSDGNYFPNFYGNEFWLLNEDLMQINSSVEELTLDLQLEPMSLFKWNFMEQMEDSWKTQRQVLQTREGESDDIKRIILDNNPYILGATALISVVHMILDTLAFKNDIQFWKNQKSMAGLSIRSLYVAIINQTIILLYLLDNDTAWMVLFSVVLGLLIDVWKVTKAVDIKLGKWNGIPFPVFVDKQSYASQTKDIDLHAMKYLNYALYPCVIGYSIYSLIYNTHKSWYSFIVSTAAVAFTLLDLLQ